MKNKGDSWNVIFWRPPQRPKNIVLVVDLVLFSRCPSRRGKSLRGDDNTASMNRDSSCQTTSADIAPEQPFKKTSGHAHTSIRLSNRWLQYFVALYCQDCSVFCSPRYFPHYCHCCCWFCENHVIPAQIRPWTGECLCSKHAPWTWKQFLAVQSDACCERSRLRTYEEQGRRGDRVGEGRVGVEEVIDTLARAATVRKRNRSMYQRTNRRSRMLVETSWRGNIAQYCDGSDGAPD